MSKNAFTAAFHFTCQIRINFLRRKCSFAITSTLGSVPAQLYHQTSGRHQALGNANGLRTAYLKGHLFSGQSHQRRDQSALAQTPSLQERRLSLKHCLEQISPQQSQFALEPTICQIHLETCSSLRDLSVLCFTSLTQQETCILAQRAVHYGHTERGLRGFLFRFVWLFF